MQIKILISEIPQLKQPTEMSIAMRQVLAGKPVRDLDILRAKLGPHRHWGSWGGSDHCG